MSERPSLQPPTGRRVRHTTYGSPLLACVTRVASEVAMLPGSHLRIRLSQLRAGLPLLLFYWLVLPSVRVPLSDGPTGRLLARHLSYRVNGRYRFRNAQGVLFLPPTFAGYLRGRHRQAVRTNIRRAREAGMTVSSSPIEDWSFDPSDPRACDGGLTAPAEDWRVLDAEGRRVAEGLLIVDERTALLNVARSEVSYARWLMHAAIIERLCGRVELMIVYTDDVPLLPDGTRHYQRLLGYSIVRVQMASTLVELLHQRWVRVLAMCALAAGAIVANRWALGPGAPFGERTLIWVTALVLVRRASCLAGPAAMTAGLAALSLLVMNGLRHPQAALGYLLAGIALDLLLATIPRLTWGSVSVTPAGAAMSVLALGSAEPARLIHPAQTAASGPSVWLAAPLLGAVAAALGWWLGGRLLPLISARPESKSPPNSGFRDLLRGTSLRRGASPIAVLRGRPATERTSTMLTLTPTASAAVHALLDNPDLPESSGLRLQSQIDPAGQPGIGIEVVSAPVDGDQLVPAGDGHDVFLSPDLVPVLDDQVLDAELDERRVAFSLRPQALDGQA